MKSNLKHGVLSVGSDVEMTHLTRPRGLLLLRAARLLGLTLTIVTREGDTETNESILEAAERARRKRGRENVSVLYECTRVDDVPRLVVSVPSTKESQ